MENIEKSPSFSLRSYYLYYFMIQYPNKINNPSTKVKAKDESLINK